VHASKRKTKKVKQTPYKEDYLRSWLFKRIWDKKITKYFSLLQDVLLYVSKESTNLEHFNILKSLTEIVPFSMPFLYSQICKSEKLQVKLVESVDYGT
jgi:hypothetical protein